MTMNGQRKKILAIKCQLIFVEGMKELENHHLVTIVVIISSVKKHQWIMVRVWWEKNIYSLKVYAHKMLINYKRKMNSFILEKPDR